MKYFLEIYHEGECIEQRESTAPFPVPLPGEQIHIQFTHRSYSDEHGCWWVVLKRRHLLFGEGSGLYTLMLDCEPDPDIGDPGV